jgi:hypothetical protein
MWHVPGLGGWWQRWLVVPVSSPRRVVSSGLSSCRMRWSLGVRRVVQAGVLRRCWQHRGLATWRCCGALWTGLGGRDMALLVGLLGAGGIDELAPVWPQRGAFTGWLDSGGGRPRVMVVVVGDGGGSGKCDVWSCDSVCTNIILVRFLVSPTTYLHLPPPSPVPLPQKMWAGFGNATTWTPAQPATALPLHSATSLDVECRERLSLHSATSLDVER